MYAASTTIKEYHVSQNTIACTRIEYFMISGYQQFQYKRYFAPWKKIFIFQSKIS